MFPEPIFTFIFLKESSITNYSCASFPKRWSYYDENTTILSGFHKTQKGKGTVRQFINYILSTLTGELAMSMVIEPKWTLAGEKETIRRINFSKKKLYWFLKKNNCR